MFSVTLLGSSFQRQTFLCFRARGHLTPTSYSNRWFQPVVPTAAISRAALTSNCQHPTSAVNSRIASDLNSLASNCLSLSLMLRPTFTRPVCLRIKHPSGTHDQIFIDARRLRVCWCGEPSLTRERVCRLQLLLVLTCTVILGSEFHGTRDHILLFQIRDFTFRRLLRLAGLRWRYSTPAPHGIFNCHSRLTSYVTPART
jgi:hypothetical protein